MKKNALISDDLEEIKKLNNTIQLALNESKVKYISSFYSPIYQKKKGDKDVYCILVCLSGKKRRVIMKSLSELEKDKLKRIDIEQWKQL